MENLDRQVERLVFEKELPVNYRGSPYTQDPGGFMKVIQAMIDKGYDFECDHDEEGWAAYFYNGGSYRSRDNDESKGETMAEAVCQAAVDAQERKSWSVKKALDFAKTYSIGPKRLEEVLISHDCGTEVTWALPESILEDSKVSTHNLDAIRKEWAKCSNFMNAYSIKSKKLTECMTKGFKLIESSLTQGHAEVTEECAVNTEGITVSSILLNDLATTYSNQQLLFDYEKTEKAVGCIQHDWRQYTGLTETYKYCTRCDEKA